MMKMDMGIATVSDFEALFARVEQILKAHGRFVVATTLGPKFNVDRQGWTVDVTVKLLGSRKRRADDISGNGDTPAAAVERMGAMLDFYVEAWGGQAWGSR